ncbi:GNAT family N-acetyltransferase [Aureibacter tunicatorum]|uniref:Aminoglycoside 6'-N-acetyltransferase I n=1 Tax=Aureibacter tunicatorum TaxID=866807 RepID=A0AAE3XPG6_9BACT|nr:GNAT family N-acetyltransferase [Aureibacter tunicatorum]MDR6238864.1 aminoglycoside 6'-N-acetyltransferase I [Aureibacter tunicatorum]BDD05209.1 putative N-acetyltransferase YvbK [Aureibacter tunicatorum]
MKIRLLNKGEAVPYDLLLLADESKEAIDKYIFGSDIYLLEHEGDILAVYVLARIDDRQSEIKNIAVKDAWQGKGLGKMLLQDACEKAKSIGCKQLLIGTGDASLKQLYIYQKAGFEMSFIRHNFFLENYPCPIFENGLQLKHMVVLAKGL